MRIVSTVVLALGLCACSFNMPLSGPQRSEPVADAEEVAATNAENREAEPAIVVNGSECITSCRARADSEYNACRAQTPGNEANCAAIRERIYAACPGECG